MQQEQESITPEQWLQVPIYIKDQLKSMEGRSRRGRLWIPRDIPIHEIPWDDNHQNSKRCERAGGIVIHETDKEAVLGLPGLVTNLKLDTYQEGSEASE